MSKHESVTAGRVIDAEIHLLDRTVLDVNGVPVSTVADLELSDIASGEIPEGTEAPVVINILDGPVLGTRVFGGHPPRSRFSRIAWSDVARLETAVVLSVAGETLDATWAERWTRDHIIARIPGGRHDPE